MEKALQKIEKSFQKKDLDPKLREALLQKREILMKNKIVRK